jgi:hypothetical protein
VVRTERSEEVHFRANALALLGHASAAGPIEDSPFALKIFGGGVLLKALLEIDAKGIP